MMEQQIDVRKIPFSDRHTVIFKAFDALAAGGSFEILADHDPKPLFSQFESQRPEAFTWNYIEAGPCAWRIRIGKKADATTANESEEGCCGICESH